MMTPSWLLLVLPALLAQPPAAGGESARELAARVKRERLLEIYNNEAAGYIMYRDSSRKERVELEPKPVYVWTNPIREGEQDGAVYVWTCRGRAEVLGSFFSFPSTGTRNLCHEFHSLSLSVLDVSRSGGSQGWAPEAPGIKLTPIAGASAPGRTPAQRLVQMRALSHDFTASTMDDKETKWELRLLPQPLYRYKSTDPEVLDGALFAFVTSAGTDPEALLVIEARKPAAGGEPVWHYAAARFTDLNIWVRHKGEVFYTAPYVPHGMAQQDPQHRYRVFHDRDIPPVEDQP
jgi:hypothetical protein